MRPVLLLVACIAIAGCGGDLVGPTGASGPRGLVSLEILRADFARNVAEVRITNRTDATQITAPGCQLLTEKPMGIGWTVAYRPDCTAVFPTFVSLDPGETHDASTRIEVGVPEGEYRVTLTTQTARTFDGVTVYGEWSSEPFTGE